MKKIIILLAGLALIVAGIFVYKNWRRNFLRNRVPALVFLESDSLYKISYEDIYIDELSGEIKINNLRLIPDTTYKKIADSTLPRQLMEVFVPGLHITGVKTDEAILNKEIIAKKIELTRPVVIMYNNYYGTRPAKKEKVTTTDIYKVILRNLQQINIDTILVTNAGYSILEWTNRDTILSASGINAHLYNLSISDSASADTSRILFSKKAELSVKNLVIKGNKEFYNYRFDEVLVNSGSSRFTVKNIFVVPLLSEPAFMQAARWQTDRFNFDFSGVQFNNVNVQELLEGNLVADTLLIAESMFKIFRDLSYPRQDISKVGNYPHQLLLKAPMDVSFKKVIIQNGYIEYKEKNPKSDRSGNVHFNNVQATFNNVTNRDYEINNNAVCELDFKSNFLDKAPLTATLQMFLGHPQGKFAIKGSLNSTDARVFNALSRPMGLAEIKDGTLHRLNFNLVGNDYTSSGSVLMLYKDLNLTLLKIDSADNSYKKKGLTSFLANIKIINENPYKNKPVRRATVTSYKRDTQRSFFNLLWKSVFEGVKESVGIGAKEKS